MKSQLDVKITLGTGIAVFVLLALFSDALTVKELLSLIGKAISITVVARYLFVKWIWKWRWLRFLENLHGTPYLEGEWDGIVNSTGNDSTPADRKKVNVAVKICQPDIFSVKIIRTSDEGSSSSSGGAIQKMEDGRYVLSYSYLSDPDATVRKRSPISYGAARLILVSSDSLSGNYWTDQKTTGTLVLKRKS